MYKLLYYHLGSFYFSYSSKLYYMEFPYINRDELDSLPEVLIGFSESDKLFSSLEELIGYIDSEYIRELRENPLYKSNRSILRDIAIKRIIGE